MAAPVQRKKKKKKKKTTPSHLISNKHKNNDHDPFSDHKSDSQPRLISHVIATKVQLFRLDVAKKEKIEIGFKIAAVIPIKEENVANPTVTWSIIVYESKNRRLILSVDITKNDKFKLFVLNDTSLSFTDHANGGDLYQFTFADNDMLHEFVYCCTMVKIPREDIDSDSHYLFQQDLNNAPNGPVPVNDRTAVAHTQLTIWIANKDKHPYSKGKQVYKGDKAIYLKTGKWIMPAVANVIKGMRPNLKRLVIAPPQYGFGEKGNEKLRIRRNATLIIEIQLKSIEQEQRQQLLTKDHSLLNDDYKSNGNLQIDLRHFELHNEKLKEEILRLNARISELVKENDGLRQKVDFHQIDSKKEKKALKDALKKEDNTLRNGLTNFGGQFDAYSFDIDYTKKHYLEWNCEDIVDWVLSLSHGAFAKYSSLLKTNTKKQNIKGKHLSKINKREWRTLGILDVDDQCLIIDQVKALTMEEKQKYANNFEGFADNYEPSLFD